jgi:hypothetical protein
MDNIFASSSLDAIGCPFSVLTFFRYKSSIYYDNKLDLICEMHFLLVLQSTYIMD